MGYGKAKPKVFEVEVEGDKFFFKRLRANDFSVINDLPVKDQPYSMVLNGACDENGEAIILDGNPLSVEDIKDLELPIFSEIITFVKEINFDQKKS